MPRGFCSFRKHDKFSGGLNPNWWAKGLTFWAPFDRVADPLKLNRGVGALSFTRATDASFLNPDTGLIEMVGSGNLRIEADGALIEGARTNILLYSETFDDAPWTKAGCTVDDDATTSPDGSSTADRLIETAEGTSHPFYQSVTLTAAAYAFSVYLKAGERTWGFLSMATGGVDNGAYFDLSIGVVGTITAGYTAGIEAVGGGWYRCWIVKTGTAVTWYPAIVPATNGSTHSYLGDITKGLYVWGAQLEAGAFPSSYIPTTSAAVTRNRDDLTMLSSGNFSDAVGTIALTVDGHRTTGASVPFLNTDGSYMAPLYLYDSATGNVWHWDGTNNVGCLDLTLVEGVPANVCKAYSGSSAKMAMNGAMSVYGPIAFDGSWNSVASMALGYGVGYGASIFGHIKNLRLWNRALSDSELQLIT